MTATRNYNNTALLLKFQDDSKEVNSRQARGIYRRLPVFGLDEVPRDSAVNCRAFCDKLYGKLLQNSLHFQACIGICASMLCLPFILGIIIMKDREPDCL